MIRIKVKVLACWLAALLILGASGYYVLPALLLKLEKYDALLALFPNNTQAPDALYWAAEEALPIADEEGLLYIYANWTSWSQGNPGTTKESVDYAQSMLEKLIEQAPDYRHIENAKWKLAQIYLANKDWERAGPLFKQIASSEAGAWQDEAKHILQMLETRKPSADKQPSLTGSVRIGDKPAADIYVLLHRKDDNGWMSNPIGHYPAAITNEDGVYRFYNIPPNEYEVGVGIRSEVVNGYFLTEPENKTIRVEQAGYKVYDLHFVPKVNVTSPTNREKIGGKQLAFQWEDYPGASTYKVNITAIGTDREGNVTGTSTVSLQEEWRESEAVYEVETLRTYSRGYGKSGNGDFVWVSNSSILGAVYPGGDFVWSVDAYDSHGKRISSSSGYYTSLGNETPFFSMDTAGQLEGDRLVQRGKYEEAIKAYEKEISNPFALRALAIMYFHGWTFEDHGDKAKALPYLEQIQHPSAYDYQLMAEAYDALGRKAEAEQARSKISGIIDR